MLAYENALLHRLASPGHYYNGTAATARLQSSSPYVVSMVPLRIGEGFPLSESLPQRSVGVGEYYGV